MGQLTFLLDAGHGGMVDGKYTTSPNFSKSDKSTWHKSWYHESEDLVFYEGVYNRQIINLVKGLMDSKGMKYIDVVNSEFDVSLSDRKNKANTFFDGDKNCFYFSMHGNASGSGKANGIEIITSKGQTKSDTYATFILESIKDKLPDEKYRQDLWSDGDVDKELNLYVLRKTKMPAVLLEAWFFDNLEDCLKMSDSNYQIKLANAIVEGFAKIQEHVNNL